MNQPLQNQSFFPDEEEGKKQGEQFKSCSNNRVQVGNREEDKAEVQKQTISEHIKYGQYEVCGISLVAPP